MTDNPIESDIINDQDLLLAFRLMKKGAFDDASELINQGIQKAKKNKNPVGEGLFLSAMGVLYKLKKAYKKAYKCYQQAEKMIPDDQSLKIITAVLLIEEFHQYETAIQKLDKIMAAEQKDPAIIHHALALKGRACLALSKKSLARDCMEKILAQDFDKLRFAANIDFKVVEAFTRKGFELLLCRTFLEKALELAKKTKDNVFSVVIQELLNRLGVYETQLKKKTIDEKNKVVNAHK